METVTLINADGELTVQVQDSITEWITIDKQSTMEIKQ